jgi:hypothetical protein
VRRFSDGTHAEQVNVRARPLPQHVDLTIEPSERSLGEGRIRSAKSDDDFKHHLVESSRYSCKGSSAMKQSSMRKGGYAPHTRVPGRTLASMQLPVRNNLRSGVAHLGCKPKVLGQDGLLYVSTSHTQLVWCAPMEHVLAIPLLLVLCH